jgi:pyrimidine 5'-nucleotidase
MVPRQQDSEAEKDNDLNTSNFDENGDDRIDVLLFDLDGTLYDHACGYEQEIHSNIFEFMVETKGGKFDAITTLEEAQRAWQPIFDKYNLTKRGLIGEGYVFDSRHYDSFVRKGADKYFSKDVELRSFLESFPSRMKKVVFTNAPESSANEILTLLGVRDLFSEVLGTDFLESKVCKPEREAFSKILRFLFSADDHCSSSSSPPSSLESYHDRNRRICYFEDSFKNLKVGKELGFRTVFITSETLQNEGKSSLELEAEKFDAILQKRVNTSLRSQLPQLWKD